MYFFHSRHAHKRFPQGTDTFVAIVALGRDIDCLEHLTIGGVVQVMRISWVHHPNFAGRRTAARIDHDPTTNRLPSLSLKMA